MERVVSGVRPTGHIHLGNYFGAIKNFVKMQDAYQCFFFIADYHSLTTQPKPADLHANVKEVIATYLACGLDPEKTVLYVQSDVPQIPELFLLLCMIAYQGELERSTTYKDKIAKQQDNINAGLLTYPVLMSADIIVHKATKVPVGKDQEQHLEMARTFANRFNNIYGAQVFPEPFGFSYDEKLVKIPGLDGSGKMGKSEGEANAIYFIDEPEVLRKKVMRAVTDTGPTEKNQQKPEAIENLFSLMKTVSSADTVNEFEQHYNDCTIRYGDSLMKTVSSADTVNEFEQHYNDCTIRYGDFKKKLAEDMITFTTPFRERIKELMTNEERLGKIVRQGADRARESAAKTLKEVRETIGIKNF